MNNRWSLIEVPRYLFYLLKLLEVKIPTWLLFLRYNLFFVLYPAGISGEILTIINALPYIKEVISKDLDFVKIAKMVRTRIEVFTDIKDHIDFFETLSDYDIEMFNNKKSKCNKEIALSILQEVLPILEGVDDYSNDNLYAVLTDYAAK